VYPLDALNSEYTVPDYSIPPSIIAEHYGNSLIHRNKRIFNTPWWGDYFDMFYVTEVAMGLEEYPTSPASLTQTRTQLCITGCTPLLEWSREKGRSITIKQHNGKEETHCIDLFARPPIGLSQIIEDNYAGDVVEELNFMLTLGLSKLDKDKQPWLREDYSPYWDFGS
jgi:hypothetical protein